LDSPAARDNSNADGSVAVSRKPVGLRGDPVTALEQPEHPLDRVSIAREVS